MYQKKLYNIFTDSLILVCSDAIQKSLLDTIRTMEPCGSDGEATNFGAPSVDDLSDGEITFNGQITPPRLHRSNEAFTPDQAYVKDCPGAPCAPRKRKRLERPMSPLLFQDGIPGRRSVGDWVPCSPQKEAKGEDDRGSHEDGQGGGGGFEYSGGVSQYMAPIPTEYLDIPEPTDSQSEELEDGGVLVLGADGYWQDAAGYVSDSGESMDES
jgi:hypothetical protein